MNDLILIDSCCELTKTSLKFKGEVTKDQWGKVFTGLKTIEGCVQFWIGDALKYREQKWGMYLDVAEQSGYEVSTLKDYKAVSEAIKPSLRNDNLGFHHHKAVTALPEDKQEKYLTKAVDNDWSVKELREAIKNDKFVKVDLPKGKFNVIYADPPWQFSNSGLNESADSKYKTMPTDEICAMPIKDMTTSDSVLFIWATASMLEDALTVLLNWGFSYKTHLIWAKNKGPSIGWFLQTRHELLLIGTKSNNIHPKFKPVSWFEADVRAHSQKPDCVYEMIQKMYCGPYIELFSRQKKEGWTSYGNEISES